MSSGDDESKDSHLSGLSEISGYNDLLKLPVKTMGLSHNLEMFLHLV